MFFIVIFKQTPDEFSIRTRGRKRQWRNSDTFRASCYFGSNWPIGRDKFSEGAVSSQTEFQMHRVRDTVDKAGGVRLRSRERSPNSPIGRCPTNENSPANCRRSRLRLTVGKLKNNANELTVVLDSSVQTEESRLTNVSTRGNTRGFCDCIYLRNTLGFFFRTRRTKIILNEKVK